MEKVKLLTEDEKKLYDMYGNAKRVYQEYERLRRQLGKTPSTLMTLEEIEKNLKVLGARRY